jgi:hypothetical protein
MAEYMRRYFGERCVFDQLLPEFRKSDERLSLSPMEFEMQAGLA